MPLNPGPITNRDQKTAGYKEKIVANGAAKEPDERGEGNRTDKRTFRKRVEQHDKNAEESFQSGYGIQTAFIFHGMTSLFLQYSTMDKNQNQGDIPESMINARLKNSGLEDWSDL